MSIDECLERAYSVAMSEPAPSEPAALLGKSLRDGRYAISGVLGEGSQGATLEAVDKRDGRLVAIKRFVVRGARSWKEVELAEREARVLSKLSHRLLPEALDQFEEGGALYLVMEKIDGPTLAQRGRATEAQVYAFLRDAAEVLDYLHSHAPPVIHRDIKPGNVIAHPGDDARHVLVDFGSVRDHLTPRGGSTVVGTFGYMAPEQLQGRALPATDVYAVGATAMRMLTGIEPEHLPHKGLAIDVRAALGKHANRELCAALEAMLVPDPEQRAAAIGPLLSKVREPLPEKRPRKKARAERKARRRRERRRQRLPPIVRPVVAIALAVARLAVAVALLAVVPSVLSLLSIVFGKQLRVAARHVVDAAERADRAIVAARDYALHRPDDAARGARVEADEKRPQRIANSRIEDTIDEVEGVVDEALGEVEAEIERLRHR
jgi:hypothetical protein